MKTISLSSSSKKRIDSLSGIKLCLQIWIISTHLYAKKSHPWFGQLPANCPSALTCFFLLSGFCNELAYGDVAKCAYDKKGKLVEKRWTKLNILGYYIRRYASFFPVYWISIFVAIYVTVTMKGVPFSYTHLFSRQFISVATMTWTWHSRTHKFITWVYNGALWYMSTISFCWFVYPILRYVLRKISNSHTQMTIIMCISMILSCLPALYLVNRENQIPPFYGGSAFGFWYINPIHRLPHFWLGMVLCKAYKTDYGICGLKEEYIYTHSEETDTTNTHTENTHADTYNQLHTPLKTYPHTYMLNKARLTNMCVVFTYSFINFLSAVGIIYVHGYMPSIFSTSLKQSTFLWMGTAPLFAVFIYTCCIGHCRYSPFVCVLSSPACAALVPGGTIGFVYLFQTPSHYLMGGDFYAKLLLMWLCALTCNSYIFVPVDTFVKKRVNAKIEMHTKIDTDTDTDTENEIADVHTCTPITNAV